MVEVRIRVSEKTHDELMNIAKDNEGVTLSSFLRPKFRKIIDEYFNEHPKKVTQIR